MLTYTANRRPRILLAEDDDLLQDLFFDILTQEGYEIDQAFTGEDALIKLADHHYDVCILDLMFKHSKTQGLDVLKTIHATFPALPVVVMSGRASDEVVLNTIGEGCFSFIVKPVFDLYLLLHIIREAVGKNKTAAFQAAPPAFHARIKGLPVDAHLYLRQFLTAFETYTTAFKGVQTTVKGFESILDDLKIQIVSNATDAQVQIWLQEYLHFAEQHEPLNPTFEIPVAYNDALAVVAQLKNTVEHFVTNMEKSSRRNYADPAFAAPADGIVFEVNYQKMLNNVRMKKETAESFAFRYAVKRITEQTQQLIEADQTLEALTGLFEFTHQYHHEHLKKEIIQIRSQLNRLINHNQSGNLSFQQFSAIKDRIHSAVLYDVLVKIEELTSLRA